MIGKTQLYKQIVEGNSVAAPEIKPIAEANPINKVGWQRKAWK
ncbi:hypothetical protein O9929_04795 [Vibrio lentus]|nr:hypothetical protein [Vibrio lentus]